MKLDNIPTFEGEHINVIVETPLGSQLQYGYDPLMDVMKMKHQLPTGYFFAFNSGFIPNTQGEDGDPLNVIIYSGEVCVSGALVECRVAGALLANQTKDGRTIRNDRIIAVPASGVKSYDSIKNVDDIDRRVLSQWEKFLISYERYRGIAFNTIEWVSSAKALAVIRNAIRE